MTIAFPALPQAAAAKGALQVAAAVAAAVALCIAAWFFLIRPDAALRQAATSRGEAITARAQAGAAQDTVRIVVDNQTHDAVITHRTEVTNHDILSAPGAAQAVDPDGYGAFVGALCLQDNRRDPQCADVLHRDGDGERPEG